MNHNEFLAYLSTKGNRRRMKEGFDSFFDGGPMKPEHADTRKEDVSSPEIDFSDQYDDEEPNPQQH